MPWPIRKEAGLDASEKQSFGKGVFRRCDGCGEEVAHVKTTTGVRLILNPDPHVGGTAVFEGADDRVRVLAPERATRRRRWAATSATEAPRGGSSSGGHLDVSRSSP